jgi:NAD(P)-dependent dehydrogenase (short-subunit alcohol dehydrogenase family)
MDRVVLVTGASRGIGRATALRLSRAGFTVFATVRHATDASRLDRDSGGSVRPVQLDLTDPSTIRRAITGLRTSGVAALQGLVNVAAPGGRAVPMEAVTQEDLEEQLGVTVTGTALLTAAAIPLLAAARGRIVNIGAGALAMPLLGAGSAAKAALETMSDILRIELAARGIRVSVVEPGMTRWEDAAAQLASYDDALDRGVAAVRAADRARYERSASTFKALNRRLLARGATADRVAETVERALTARRPRARYYCGVEQRFAAVLARTPSTVTDRVLRRLIRL